MTSTCGAEWRCEEAQVFSFVSAPRQVAIAGQFVLKGVDEDNEGLGEFCRCCVCSSDVGARLGDGWASDKPGCGRCTRGALPFQRWH